MSVLEHEARLIGRLMLDAASALQAANSLLPEHIYERTHRAIYQAVLELLASGGRVSPTAVAQHPTVRRAGVSWEQIARLLEEPALEVEVPDLIEYLRSHALRRRVREAASKLVQLAEGDLTVDEFEEQASSAAARILAELAPPDEHGAPTLGSALATLVAGYEQPERRRRTAIGLPRTVGHALGGLRAGDLYILMARPSMGKSAMALQWATDAIRIGGAKAVLFVSLEMTAETLADRVLLQQTGQSLIRRGSDPAHVRRQVLDQLDDALTQLQQWPLYISERRGLRASDIAVLARRVAGEHGRLDLVVVDYLQLIRYSQARGQTQASAVGDVCRQLRDLAGDLGCPMVVLSQLNRGVETRENKRPVLSDLRDSGNIEEAADVVVSLYREEYYLGNAMGDGDPRRGMAEVAILKNRHGESGEVYVLRWIPERQRFEEVSEDEERAYIEAVWGAKSEGKQRGKGGKRA